MSAVPPLFSIVGTTSVGKSDASLDLAQYLIDHKYCSGVSIISADSRQIYQGLEILSGADIPPGFVKTRDVAYSELDFFQKDSIKIFGLSAIKVTQDWSVSQFRDFARKIIITAFSRGEVVLIVGGTGLYHNYILNTDPHLAVPPNQAVREKAKNVSIPQLHMWLEQINPQKLAEMNNSDRHNSRRLVRAIEISLADTYIVTKTADQTLEKQAIEKDALQDTSQHFFGLHISPEQLSENIAKRVTKRFTEGALIEVQKILELQEVVSPPIMSTLGFSELQAYTAGKKTASECQAEWTLAENQYSKRQLTWWKKQTDITWFEKSDPRWFEKMSDSITKLLTDNLKK